MRMTSLFAAGFLSSAALLVSQGPAPTGTPVFGLVLDPEGGSTAGVEVRAVGLEHEGLPEVAADVFGGGAVVVGRTRTDERGRFVLRVEDRGVLGLVAVREDGARSFVVTPIARGLQSRLTLRPVRLLRGRVLDVVGGAPRPAAGCRVWSVGPVHRGDSVRLEKRSVLGVVDAATTDAEGWFEVPVFAAARGGMRVPGGHFVPVQPVDGEAPEPVVVRRVNRRIRCRIVDRVSKAPVPGGRIHVAGRTYPADAEGQCVAEIPRGFPIDVEGDGYALQRLPTILVDEFAAELTPTARAHMRFVGGVDRKPCAGLEVCVIRPVPREHPGSFEPLAHRQRAGADGRLSLNRSVDPAVVYARIGSRFVRLCQIDPIAGQGAGPGVKAGTGDQDLGDVSTRLGDLHGTVIGVGGTPEAHVPVFCELSGTGFGPRLPLAQGPLAHTDHGGRFTIRDLPWQPHDLAVRSPRSLARFVDRMVPGRETPLRIELAAAPLLRGRVVDDAGQPVAEVLLLSGLAGRDQDDEYVRNLYRFGLGFVAARTGPDGGFVLPALVAEREQTVRAMVSVGYRAPLGDRFTAPAEDLVITLQRRR